jgi:hypothetical protein
MRILFLFTFLAALSQLLSPTFLYFDGFTSINPLITPANYAFAIWLVITIGCTIFAGYQLFWGNLCGNKFESINIPSIILFICYSLWLWLASINQQVCTLVIILVMFGTLLFIHSKLQLVQFSKLEEVIVHAPFLLYLGWTAIAVFANLTSVFAAQGLISNGEKSLLFYILTLIIALCNAIWVGIRVQFNWYYVGTIIWAFTAIIFASIARGSSAVPLVCIFAIYSILASKYYSQKLSLTLQK